MRSIITLTITNIVQRASEKQPRADGHADKASLTLSIFLSCAVIGIERVQKGIVHWNKQNNDVPAPNCVLKVQGEIIKVEGL